MSDYVVRINRSQGSLEVLGNDQAWVDRVVKELEYVYKEVPAPPSHNTVGNDASDEHKQQRQTTNHTSSEQKPPKRTSKGKRPEIDLELQGKINSDVAEKLANFISERSKAFESSLPAQAIIIAIFLEDELNLKGITKRDLYTVYRTLGMTAGDTGSQLRNAYARNHYFSHSDDGKFFPSTSGEAFARYGSKNGES